MTLATLDQHARPHPAGFRDVSARDAAGALGAMRLIDVRQPEELHGDLGRIDGVENVPLGTLPFQALSWDRNAPVLVICRSGGRSSAAASELSRMGFRHVYNLAGGMMAWNQAGLPVA